MLPTTRPIRPIEDGRANGDAATSEFGCYKRGLVTGLRCLLRSASQAGPDFDLDPSGIHVQRRGSCPGELFDLGNCPNRRFNRRLVDPSQAAKCLGISTTTLYRYAEQEKIEFRKIGNRLGYRRSALDQFKEQHVRPARRTRRQEV